MRNIELQTVEIGDELYPIYCDLYVLSQIQERMNINDFERGILGAQIIRDENNEPLYDENGRLKLEFGQYDVNALLVGLTLMINEGLLIDSEQRNVEYEPVEEKYLARICNMPLIELSNIVHEAFGRCLVTKKNTKTIVNRKKNTSK